MFLENHQHQALRFSVQRLKENRLVPPHNNKQTATQTIQAIDDDVRHLRKIHRNGQQTVEKAQHNNESLCMQERLKAVRQAQQERDR